MSRLEDDSMYTIGLEADDYAKLEKKYEDALAEIEALKQKLHVTGKEVEHYKRVNARIYERLEVMKSKAQDYVTRTKRNEQRNKREAGSRRRQQEFLAINMRSGWDS